MTFPHPVRIAAPAAVAALALGLALVPMAANAADADDINWAVSTAAGDFGDDRTAFRYTLDPGAAVEDGLVIANHGAAPLDLGVYAADGFTTDAGQLDLVVAGAESTSIGVWVQADTDHVTVPAGGTVTVPFTVRIPENATPGDYAGGIVTSIVEPDDAAGINVDRRLGIRIDLRVGGDLVPSLAVEGLHVDYAGSASPFAGGDATVSFTLHNTGNTTLAASESATLTGPFGWWPSTVGALEDAPELLPGERWTVTTTAHDVPAAVVLIASATVVPVVVDISGSTTPLAAVTVSGNGWAVPWALVVTVLVLAALVAGGLLLRRRLLAHAKRREDERVRDAVERALAGADPLEG
jgi:hypothetical protein